MLKLDGLLVGYSRSSPILATPPTEVHAGQLVCLLGRNGHGKSTLLRTLAGLQPPLCGTVELAGQVVDRLLPVERARRIGVVLTDRPHLPGMSARELVELGRIPFTSTLGLLTARDREIALGSLDAVGGAHLAQRSLDTLSDGERQRVMIARALAQQPVLLLLDEITAFLDLPSRVAICSTLRRIARDQRMAVVMSSHDLELAIQTADRLWVLPGDGTMVSGAPEDVALSGVIASAFDHHDIGFSLETGRFEPTAARGAPIAVSGHGLAPAWAKRAINRRGWRASDVSDSAAGILVDAADTTAGFRWTVQWSDRRRSCASIAELIDTLSELHDAQSH